jgi:hypothetical protein
MLAKFENQSAECKKYQVIAFTTCRESRGESIGKDQLLKPVLRPGGLDLPTQLDFQGVIQL